jgi:hypothetical protein
MSDRKQAIEWPPQWAVGDLFGRITDLALRGAEECPPRAWWALRYLKDCEPDPTDPSAFRGATYKQLAYVGHRAGMDAQERAEWYAIAETLGLTQRHAGHIIARAPDIREQDPEEEAAEEAGPVPGGSSEAGFDC